MEYRNYILTGNKGTVIEVTTILEGDVCVDVPLYCVHTIAKNAPFDYGDLFALNEDFIICKCIDGDLQNGQQWHIALDDLGGLTDLTHFYMAENSLFDEVLTCELVIDHF